MKNKIIKKDRIIDNFNAFNRAKVGNILIYKYCNYFVYIIVGKQQDYIKVTMLKDHTLHRKPITLQRGDLTQNIDILYRTIFYLNNKKIT